MINGEQDPTAEVWPDPEPQPEVLSLDEIANNARERAVLQAVVESMAIVGPLDPVEVLVDAVRQAGITAAVPHVGDAALTMTRPRSYSRAEREERWTTRSWEVGDAAAIDARVDAAIGRAVDANIAQQHQPMPDCDPPEYLIESLMYEESIAVFYGHGGTGKTLLAMYVATQVARERGDVLDRRVTKHGRVLYLDFERSERIFRSSAHIVARGAGLSEPPERLRYYRPKKGLLINGEVAPDILQEIAEYRPNLIVIDSCGYALRKSGVADDNVLEFFAELRALIENQRPHPAVLINDHVSKRGARDKDGGDQFGSAYKWNSADVEVRVSERIEHRPGEPKKLQIEQLKNQWDALTTLNYTTEFTGERRGKAATFKADDSSGDQSAPHDRSLVTRVEEMLRRRSCDGGWTEDDLETMAIECEFAKVKTFKNFLGKHFPQKPKDGRRTRITKTNEGRFILIDAV